MEWKPLLEFVGVVGGPAGLGAVFVALMWNADSLVRPESRAALGKGSREFWAAGGYRFDVFRKLYDRLYDTQTLLRPSFRKFLIIAPLTLLILGAVVFLRAPGAIAADAASYAQAVSSGLFLSVAAGGGIFAVFFLVPNILIDYLSVWGTKAHPLSIAQALRAGNVTLKPVQGTERPLSGRD